MYGCIVAWHGAIVDIPSGWALCDGASGTPDLRDAFVVGAGASYDPGDSGGLTGHTHTGTTDGHTHSDDVGAPWVIDAAAVDSKLTTNVDTFTTDPAEHLPPYYALAWIMHL